MAMLFSYADADASHPAACRASGCWPEERILAHLLRTAATSPPDPFKSLSGAHPVDVLLSKDAYELCADAPGLTSGDITVEVLEGVLHLAAGAVPTPSAASATSDQRPSSPSIPPTSSTPSSAPAIPALARPTSPPTASGRKVLRRERAPRQQWSRSFLLPENADADAISVRLERGVLTVTIPICPPPPKPLPRRILVSSGAQ